MNNALVFSLYFLGMPKMYNSLIAYDKAINIKENSNERNEKFSKFYKLDNALGVNIIHTRYTERKGSYKLLDIIFKL